ncbi:MAG: STAS domain-containing protein [Planctomycetota bacterium]
MNIAKSRYRIARNTTMVYVRAEGLANMKTAPLLHSFLNSARSEGVKSVYIDLSDCAGMDSTFMGLLVGNAQSFTDAGGRLAVVKPNELCLRLLQQLGVDEVVTVVPDVEVPSAEYVDIDTHTAVDAKSRADLVRQAHVNLASLNDGNKAKFSAFLKALDADLSKKKKPS